MSNNYTVVIKLNTLSYDDYLQKFVVRCGVEGMSSDLLELIKLVSPEPSQLAYSDLWIEPTYDFTLAVLRIIGVPTEYGFKTIEVMPELANFMISYSLGMLDSSAMLAVNVNTLPSGAKVVKGLNLVQCYE